MTTKAKIGFILFILILAMPFMLACEDGGTVQETGQEITIDLLFGVSEVEQAVQDAVDSSCNPSVTTCDPVLR